MSKELDDFIKDNILDMIYYEQNSGRAFYKARPFWMFKTDADWKRWNYRNAGKQITCNNKGYLQASFFGKVFLLHRVIHLYMTGEWPNVIDHINGNKLDDRLS